jgi:ADP-heptose:LPS heptosyltransferase
MPIRSVRDISDSVDQNELERKTGVPLSKRFIAISAIAGMPRKTWPAEKFRSLITRILDGTDCLVVLTGTRAEAGAIAAIRDGFGDRVFNIAGKMSLIELAGLLKFASGFVGNDSGTGHVAGALGIPVVSLHVQPRNSDPYHIHSAQHYRPAGPRVRIVQPEDFLAPCQGRCDRAAVHCLDQITVDQVWNALMLALTESCQKPFNAESTACVFLQHNCGKQGRQAD